MCVPIFIARKSGTAAVGGESWCKKGSQRKDAEKTPDNYLMFGDTSPITEYRSATTVRFIQTYCFGGAPGGFLKIGLRGQKNRFC